MAARLGIGVDARERLRRLAVVFAVELRLKIVVELYMREMSPKQFYEEFGGESLSRVNQNFRALAKAGWLRLIHTEGPGGHRHGGIEHFYRATEPAFFDAETWALVPYSVRATITCNFFKSVVPRLRANIEASSSEAGTKRDLSCTDLLLDDVGWKRVIDAVSAQFARLYEEQEDARRRRSHTGEKLVRADVFLIAFQPSHREGHSAIHDLMVKSSREPSTPFPARLAPILRDDERFDILSEMNRREISITQYHRELGRMSKLSISRRFQGLEAACWAAKVRVKTGGMRRGSKEKFYRPTIPAIHDYNPCTNPPSELKGTQPWMTFECLSDEIRASIISGAFDVRPNRLLTWSLIRLDRQGWESVIAGIEALSESIYREQELAKQRMADSSEQPIRMTVGLAAFEALKDMI
jgi:hypothetical protein